MPVTDSLPAGRPSSSNSSPDSHERIPETHPREQGRLSPPARPQASLGKASHRRTASRTHPRHPSGSPAAGPVLWQVVSFAGLSGSINRGGHGGLRQRCDWLRTMSCPRLAGKGQGTAVKRAGCLAGNAFVAVLSTLKPAVKPGPGAERERVGWKHAAAPVGLEGVPCGRRPFSHRASLLLSRRY